MFDAVFFLFDVRSNSNSFSPVFAFSLDNLEYKMAFMNIKCPVIVVVNCPFRMRSGCHVAKTSRFGQLVLFFCFTLNFVAVVPMLFAHLLLLMKWQVDI